MCSSIQSATPMTSRSKTMTSPSNLQRGEGLPNDDTGWLLQINRKGRNKMGDNADLSAAESKAVAGIEVLMRHAVLAETHPDLEHNNPQVFAVHRFYAPLDIAGMLYRMKLTAKTFVPELGRGRVLHALAAAEIENAPLGTLPAHETPKASKPLDSSRPMPWCPTRRMGSVTSTAGRTNCTT